MFDDNNWAGCVAALLGEGVRGSQPLFVPLLVRGGRVAGGHSGAAEAKGCEDKALQGVRHACLSVSKFKIRFSILLTFFKIRYFCTKSIRISILNF